MDGVVARIIDGFDTAADSDGRRIPRHHKRAAQRDI
jgi:hypothetical protein